jgi:hypothetical protein
MHLSGQAGEARGGKGSMTTHDSDKRRRSGESMEDAIIIQAPNSEIGVAKEYQWVEKHFGRRNVSWKLASQALVPGGDRFYDLLHIRLADGTEKKLYFDITDFFGKF